MCTNPIRLYRNDDCGWYKNRPPTPLDRLDNPDLSFSLGFIIPHYEIYQGKVLSCDNYQCFSDYAFYDLVPCGKRVERLIFRRSEWALR